MCVSGQAPRRALRQHSRSAGDAVGLHRAPRLERMCCGRAASRRAPSAPPRRVTDRAFTLTSGRRGVSRRSANDDRSAISRSRRIRRPGRFGTGPGRTGRATTPITVTSPASPPPALDSPASALPPSADGCRAALLPIAPARPSSSSNAGCRTSAAGSTISSTQGPAPASGRARSRRSTPRFSWPAFFPPADALRTIEELARAAEAVYRRIDFGWMRNGEPGLLSMGWKPESGFLSARWEHYCELMLLYLLGIGSPTHALPPASWYAWRRPTVRFEGFSFVGGGRSALRPPVFACVDRFPRAPGIARAPHRLVGELGDGHPCPQGVLPEPSTRFPGYTEQIWGITASDGPHGYQAWGGPPAHGPIDGTVVPAAAGGSLMFTPEITLAALKAMKGRVRRENLWPVWVRRCIPAPDRVGQSRRARDRRRDHAPVGRKPSLGRCLAMVHGEPRDPQGPGRGRTEACGGGGFSPVADRKLWGRGFSPANATSDPAVAAPRGPGARP